MMMHICSPLESISCSCCGNLREVVTDTEAARTSHGESLKAHTKHMVYQERATRLCQRVFMTARRARQMWAYLPHPSVKCTPCLDKSSSPSPLQPQRTSPPAPLWCPLLTNSHILLTARHILIIHYSVCERGSKVSASLLCLSSLSARRSWAFLNTRKWVAKSSTRRVVK